MAGAPDHLPGVGLATCPYKTSARCALLKSWPLVHQWQVITHRATMLLPGQQQQGCAADLCMLDELRGTAAVSWAQTTSWGWAWQHAPARSAPGVHTPYSAS